MQNKYYILTLLFAVIASCSTYRVSKEERNWIPYRPGQMVIFVNATGKKDTIFIMKEELHNHTAPMALLPDVN